MDWARIGGLSGYADVLELITCRKIISYFCLAHLTRILESKDVYVVMVLLVRVALAGVGGRWWALDEHCPRVLAIIALLQCFDRKRLLYEKEEV